jgi:hypothetical protein
MARSKDPIVDEVRQARNRHARKHKYDLKAIFADMKAWQKKHVKKTISPTAKPRLRATGT